VANQVAANIIQASTCIIIYRWQSTKFASKR